MFIGSKDLLIRRPHPSYDQILINWLSFQVWQKSSLVLINMKRQKLMLNRFSPSTMSTTRVNCRTRRRAISWRASWPTWTRTATWPMPPGRDLQRNKESTGSLFMIWNNSSLCFSIHCFEPALWKGCFLFLLFRNSQQHKVFMKLFLDSLIRNKFSKPLIFGLF